MRRTSENPRPRSTWHLVVLGLAVVVTVAAWHAADQLRAGAPDARTVQLDEAGNAQALLASEGDLHLTCLLQNLGPGSVSVRGRLGKYELNGRGHSPGVELSSGQGVELRGAYSSIEVAALGEAARVQHRLESSRGMDTRQRSALLLALLAALAVPPLVAMLLRLAKTRQRVTDAANLGPTMTSARLVAALMVTTLTLGGGYAVSEVFPRLSMSALVAAEWSTLCFVALLLNRRAVGFDDVLKSQRLTLRYAIAGWFGIPVIWTLFGFVSALLPATTLGLASFQLDAAPAGMPWMGAMLALSAGVCEEAVFRGWLLFGCLACFGSRTSAVLVTSALFGALHLPAGLVAAVTMGLAGIVAAVVTLRTRSLLPAAIAHAGHDTITILVDFARGT